MEFQEWYFIMVAELSHTVGQFASSGEYISSADHLTLS